MISQSHTQAGEDTPCRSKSLLQISFVLLNGQSASVSSVKGAGWALPRGVIHNGIQRSDRLTSVLQRESPRAEVDHGRIVGIGRRCSTRLEKFAQTRLCEHMFVSIMTA